MENNLSSRPWNSSKGERSLCCGRAVAAPLGQQGPLRRRASCPMRRGDWSVGAGCGGGREAAGSGRDAQTTPRGPWCAALSAGQPEGGPLTLRSCRLRAWARGPSEPPESSRIRIRIRIRRRALSSSGSGLGCKTWLSQDREAGYTSQHSAGGPARGLPVGRQ